MMPLFFPPVRLMQHLSQVIISTLVLQCGVVVVSVGFCIYLLSNVRKSDSSAYFVKTVLFLT